MPLPSPDLKHASADVIGLIARRQRLLMPRQLSDEEMTVFVGAGTRRPLAANELIFERGELGRSMFVVESGQVRLEFGDGLADKIIGAREFFGELALFIGNHARVASAVSTEPTMLHVVEHKAFERLLASEPELLAQFMLRSFSYLVASEQQLIASLKRRNEDLLVTLDSLRQTQSQLSTAERLIQTDELTGLCNRRGLYYFLEKIEQRRVPGTTLGLLLIDLDRFKRINDRRGHLMGDRVLRAVAAEVQGVALACDLPCRLGGDEFALLVQVADAQELQARANRVVAAVSALRFPKPNDAMVATVSVGGCMCRPDAEWAEWYSEADSALYQVKGQGGDNCKLLA